MTQFEFLLFSVDAEFASHAVAAGVNGIMIDWECRGKHRRQAGADTEINAHTLDDLCRMRAAIAAPILVRLNSFSAATEDELSRAIDGGADEVMLPMVETPGEVDRLMAMARGRVRVGILVETCAAVACASALGQLPLRRVYVGLNDLAIQRGSASIFQSLVDGTVERLREAFDVPFGLAGLTLPECGTPIPCRLLMGELARMHADFSFLRRSFHADLRGREVALEVPRMRSAMESMRHRSAAEVDMDRSRFAAAVRDSQPPCTSAVPEHVIGVVPPALQTLASRVRASV